LEDSIAAHQRVKFFNRLRKVIEELFDAVFEAGRHIHHQPADAKIRRRQTATGRSFDQIQNLFAFAKRVEEDGHRADVDRVRP
jgi:hypothetical protein